MGAKLTSVASAGSTASEGVGIHIEFGFGLMSWWLSVWGCGLQRDHEFLELVDC